MVGVRQRTKLARGKLKLIRFGISSERLFGKRRQPRSLCVIFHGLTGTGDDGRDDAACFAKLLPSTLFVLPTAVSSDWIPYDQKYIRNQKGSYKKMVLRAWRKRITQVTGYLDHLLTRYPSVDAQQNLVLVGYSQGAGVAAYTGLQLRVGGSRRVRGIIALGGVGCPRSELLPRVKTAGTGICCINGTRDDWVNRRTLQASFACYGAAIHWFEGVGHFDTASGCRKMAAICGKQLAAWLSYSL